LYAAGDAQLEEVDGLKLDANLEDCMELIRALALPHVGDKLETLRLEFLHATTRPHEQELLEVEAGRLIRAGAWPRLVGRGPGDTWPPYMALGRGKLHEAVKQALEEKLKEIEAEYM
jgi:hypothetical protein